MVTNTGGELGLLGKLQSSFEPPIQDVVIRLRDSYLGIVERYKAQKEDFAKSGVMREENHGSELVKISFQDVLLGYNPYSTYIVNAMQNIKKLKTLPPNVLSLRQIFNELHDMALVAWPIIVQAGSKQVLPADPSIDDVFK